MSRNAPKNIERRVYPTCGTELRAEDERPGIAGTAALIGSVTDLGFVTEEIAPGAFDEAIETSDIRGLFNHDANYVLGRVQSGTMTVMADEGGLRYEIPELPDSRADVLEAVARGDVTGNSFSFVIEEQRFIEAEGAKPHRVIEKVGELFDLGPVTFPAYPDTDVALRSLEARRARSDDEGGEPGPPPAARRAALAARQRGLELPSRVVPLRGRDD